MNQLQFDYPSSYLFLCGIIALLYAVFMYYRDSRWAEKSIAIPWLLGISRAIVVFILAILLLSPFLTYYEEEIEQPVILVAYDDSESMSLSEDSLLRQLLQFQEKLPEQLADYELVEVAFGDQAESFDSLTFSQSRTNISSVLEYIKNEWGGRNVGALILVTDGIYNVGKNPLYAASGLKAPIFSIPMGDTTARKDVSISDVFHNDIAYLNDKFVIQVDLSAQELRSESTALQLFQNKNGNRERIETQSIEISNDDFFKTFEFTIDADRAGVQEYNLVATAVDGETTTENNRKTFYIDVIDAQQKILIVGGAPHPDLTALKYMLSENQNYEIDVVLSDATSVQLEAYDLLILHQIPFQKRKPQFVNSLLNSELPKLYVTGLQTHFKDFNSAQNGIRIQPQRGGFNAVEPAYEKNFNAFTFPEESASALDNYPPLETIFGEFDALSGTQTIFHQKIGDVVTKYPLVALGRTTGDRRAAYILGEGIWRWRLFEFGIQQSSTPAQELIQQVVQYISVTDDKRRFVTKSSQKIYDENERINIRAEFYNENYELLNSPDAFLKVESEDGDQYDYTFGKERNFYQLDLGFLPAGNYSYTSSLNWNGERFTHAGKFVVDEIQMELFRTRANHNLLHLLAEQSGGSVFSLGASDKIAEQVKSSGSADPVLYSRPVTRSLIHLQWVFWLLIALLSMEWFFRRWLGSY